MFQESRGRNSPIIRINVASQKHPSQKGWFLSVTFFSDSSQLRSDSRYDLCSRHELFLPVWQATQLLTATGTMPQLLKIKGYSLGLLKTSKNKNVPFHLQGYHWCHSHIKKWANLIPGPGNLSICPILHLNTKGGEKKNHILKTRNTVGKSLPPTLRVFTWGDLPLLPFHFVD